MKRLSLFLSLAVLVFFSCSKEEFVESKQQNNYSLTEIEQEFFDFEKSIGSSLRQDKSYRITPEVIKVHQFVLQENQKNKFAEGINTKVGTPYWNHAYTFKTGTDDFYVLIPMYNKDLSAINGYLSGTKSTNGIVLNGMTRTKLLSNLSTNSAIKKSTLTVLAKQEMILTGSISPEIDNALCILREEINSNGIQFEGSEVLNDGSNPCNPELIEICIDQEGGYHWFGGLENLPIHLDHDQDGIINSEDQDWHERRFDLTQEEFTDLVLNHWNQNMYDDYGDYYDFWDQMGNYYDDYDGGQDWSDFMDDLQDFWDDFGDFWDDVWDEIDDFFDDIGDWFGDLFRDDIDCPEWPLQDDKENISTRSVECFTFYAWDCYDNPDYNWWSFYDGYDDDAVLLHRVNNYLDNVLTGQVDFWTLYNIAQESDCDPLSSDFEQCLDWHFNNHRDEILEEMYEQMFPNMDFLPMVRWLAKNCELGGGTQADYNSCIMNQYNTVKSNIETFLIDNNLALTFEEFLEIYLDNCVTCNILNYEDEAYEVLGLAGQDWIFDEAYWNNPDLTFQTQSLPSYQDFYDAFPKTTTGNWLYGADNIYELVGGDVLQARNDYPSLTTNTCALKLSIALNGAGIDIPEITTTSSQPGTLEGEDGNFYFLNARSLKNWMILTFGKNNTNYHTTLVSELDENVTLDDYLDSKKGALILDYGGSGTSGHADIYTGSDCSSSGCAFSGFGSIHFWELD